MAKLIQIKQNTCEWEEFRRTKIGASDCAALMQEDPYRTELDVWNSKILGKTIFVTEAMQRGKILEEVALKEISKRHNRNYFPLVFQCDVFPFMIASLDGFVNDDDIGMVEIKCPGQTTLKKVLDSGDIPVSWQWQMQHQMSVMGAFQCTLFVFSDTGKDGEFLIKRNEKMISSLLEKEQQFYQRMINFEPPEVSGLPQNNDPELVYLISNYLSMKEDIENKSIQLDSLKNLIIEHAREVSCQCQGVKIQKIFKPGNIDYKSIPLLKEVDLESYRKPGMEYWSIR